MLGVDDLCEIPSVVLSEREEQGARSELWGREEGRLSSNETDLLFPRPHDDFRIEESRVSLDVDTGESSYGGSPGEERTEGGRRQLWGKERKR